MTNIGIETAVQEFFSFLPAQKCRRVTNVTNVTNDYLYNCRVSPAKAKRKKMPVSRKLIKVVFTGINSVNSLSDRIHFLYIFRND